MVPLVAAGVLPLVSFVTLPGPAGRQRQVPSIELEWEHGTCSFLGASILIIVLAFSAFSSLASFARRGWWLVGIILRIGNWQASAHFLEVNIQFFDELLGIVRHFSRKVIALADILPKIEKIQSAGFIKPDQFQVA